MEIAMYVLCVCVRACVRACVGACVRVRACVCVCVWVWGGGGVGRYAVIHVIRTNTYWVSSLGVLFSQPLRDKDGVCCLLRCVTHGWVWLKKVLLERYVIIE